MIIAAVFWLITVATVGLFVTRAWRGVRDRDRLVRSAVDAVVMLAAVRALFPPPGWGSWLWVAAVVATGVGVAGAVVRWRRLASGPRRWVTVLNAVIGAGLVAVLA